MIKKAIFTLFSIFCAYTAVGQVVAGSLMDSLGNKIAYAHIYVNPGNLGTYSNEKGEFKISVDHFDSEDTLIISHINYVTYKITRNDLQNKKKQVYVLKEKPNLLETIAVQPLSAREVYERIINTTSNQLKGQVNLEYFRVYRAALEENTAFEERRKIGIGASEFTHADIKSDSLISMTVYDRENTNALGSFNITIGSDEDALNSFLCNKLLFDSGLDNGFLKLRLSSDSINLKNDTLWIYEMNRSLGYIVFNSINYLPTEIKYDLAKSDQLKKNILSTKLIFRMATKRGLRGVNQISFTQRYRHDNNMLTPEFFRFQSEFLTKKRGREEVVSFEKIYYPTHINIGKNRKIPVGPDLY